MLRFPKQSTVKDNRHLRFIASLPCCLSGHTEVQAAHIRAGENAGMGRKPSDEMTVPLHYALHSTQHTMNEAAFWNLHGKTIQQVKQLAKALFVVSGDQGKALELIERFR